MKRPLLATGLCLVVIGLGAIGVRHESKAELQRALASLRANLPPDSRFEYDQAYPRFLARGAGFENARFIRGDIVLAARHLTINNPTGYLATGLSFSQIHADHVTVQGPVSGTIGEVTLKKLLLPPFSREKRDIVTLPPASQIHFRHGQIHDIALTASSGCTLTMGYASLDNYGHDDGNAGSLHEGHVLCAKDSMVAGLLSRSTHQATAPVSLDITDMHESGIRYARYVGWAEQFRGGSLPAHVALLSDALETPAKTETKGLSFSFLNLQLTSETSDMRRWKEGETIETRGETRNSSLKISPASPLSLVLLPVVHINTVNQTMSFNTTTRAGMIDLTATTPKSFTVNARLAMNNLENYDAEHLPALVSTDLTYTDEGGNLDALLTRIAAQRNMTLEDLKPTLLMSLAFVVQKVPGLSAVPEFVQSPTGKSLTLSFRPPVPLDNSSMIRMIKPLSQDPAMARAWSSPPVLSTTLH
ncbi:hypothetical protein [Asaia bogorensis]|uniref:hypothetical protein n=1 Tax=Asaia bogorensis TaxID=91915 RepID=UPI002865DA76|nr:hypothetical protein [Asaia bogorensis]MDR6183757.1 hypothetical protein [Asaia bogorensis NBRC 16594]